MSTGIVADTVARILTDLADPQTLNAAADRAWLTPLWQTLEENMLTKAWPSDKLGGAGLSFSEGCEIVSASGRFALPAPLVETMLAAWLLSQAELAAPDGALTIAPVRPLDRIRRRDDGTLEGTARAVPFGGETDHIALHIAEPDAGVALVRVRDCTVRPAASLSGDTRGDFTLDGVMPIAFAPCRLSATAWLQVGSVLRSLQMAGALQAALSISVDYANERVAFGKTIGRFQAVQNNLARLAGEAAAATAAAGSAADALVGEPAHWDDGIFLETAAAKIRCAEAVESGMAIAHQVHGAIGLTREHVLHRFSLRAQDWSSDFGEPEYWAVLLGQRVARRGGDQVWALVASR